MKTSQILFYTLIVMMLASCQSTNFYQVYKAASADKLVIKDNLIVYADEHCRVTYNLWGEGGNIGFKFYNKTDKNIYLNMAESFFILNGISYNYYKNRIYTNSTSSGSTLARGASTINYVTGDTYVNLNQTNRTSVPNNVGTITTSAYSVSYNEEKIVCIPSMTSKFLSEYNVNGSLYRDCDLLKYPTKTQIKSKTFSKEQSPLIFSNRVAYSIGDSDDLIRFENEFYVKEISNLPESEVLELKHAEFCGQKSIIPTQYFKNASADMFYMKYSKGTDSWKH
jgi:hypothetical protein